MDESGGLSIDRLRLCPSDDLHAGRVPVSDISSAEGDVTLTLPLAQVVLHLVPERGRGWAAGTTDQVSARTCKSNCIPRPAAVLNCRFRFHT